MFNPQRIRRQAFSYYASLRRVEAFVDEHLSDEISLGTAARVAGLSEKYFCSFFHAKTGVCFKQWLHHLRIRRAIEMMKSRDHTITYVAFEVGFDDLRTFERAFKRCMTVTAREFRRSIRP